MGVLYLDYNMQGFHLLTLQSFHKKIIIKIVIAIFVNAILQKTATYDPAVMQI